MNQSFPDSRGPLISVIVPSFNQGRFIGATIRSVIGQDFQDWELIIQDACSTDETEQVCSDFASGDPRIRFFREKDTGFADGVNRGLMKANGKICAIQSSDDYYAASGTFREVAALFLTDPDTILIAGDFRMVDQQYRELKGSPVHHGKKGSVVAADVFTLKENFPQGSVFFSTERARMTGGLRPEVDMVADTDFWIRLTNLDTPSPGSIRRVDRVWSHAIMHPHQRSVDAARFAMGRASMYFRLLHDETIATDPALRKQAFYAALADAYHIHLQKRLATAALRGLHQRAFGTDLPWSWRLKSLLFKSNALHRLYFRKKGLSETADYLESGCTEKRNWFESVSAHPGNESRTDFPATNPPVL